MKVLLDGYAIDLYRGTGLTTYARELAGTLIARGHEVSALYGIDGLHREPLLQWAEFVQSLAIRGQPGRREYLGWGCRGAGYGLCQLAGRAARPRRLERMPWVDTSSAEAHLPRFSEVYNLPGVYGAAFMIAALSGRTLQVAPPRGSAIELFHRASPIPLRMRGVCSVVTAHDIIPLVLPQSTAINLKHYRRIVLRSLEGANRIFVVSERSRNDIEHVLGIPAERMFVTYQSVQVPESVKYAEEQDIAAQIQREFGLEYGEYFLFYGAIEPKKNLLRLLDALARTHCGLPLVIVGRNGWLYEQEVSRISSICEQPDGARRLRRFNYLPRISLMQLLRGARALVFPSLYEGFGLPPLEAMHMGVPVITSNRSSLPEVCGDAAVYVDPLDAADIAAAMDRVAADDALCATMVERGHARAEFFSPQRHAERIEEGYRLALGGE
jgi:glycosyltransferase involved in cell wall biosynthesis